MTVKELIRQLKKMPQDARVYVYYESCDCDVTPEDLVYDGTEVCLWSDTGELSYTIQDDKKGWDEE